MHAGLEDRLHELGGAVALADVHEVRPLGRLAVGVGVAGAARLRGEESFASPRVSLRLERPPRRGFIAHVADLVRVVRVGLGEDDADLLLGLRTVGRRDRPPALQADALPGELTAEERHGLGVAVDDGRLEHRGDPPAASHSRGSKYGPVVSGRMPHQLPS